VSAVERPARGDRRAIVSWALYDLANTIYYAIVVTWGMGPYVRQRYAATDALGYVIAATLLVSAFVSPTMGARVDRTGRAMPGLTTWTLVCVGMSVVLAFAAPHGKWLALAAFAVSLFAYQAALTFYNALLPAVAPPGRSGSVSGLGTGLGYVGLPLSILGALEVERRWGIPPAFALAAAMMTLWTFPLWAFVRDRPAPETERAPASRSVFHAFRDVARDRTLLLFLVANFVCADVANTLIVWANDYFRTGEGLDQTTAGHLQIALSLVAFLGGIGIGRLADRFPPTLLYALACALLCAALAGTAVFPRTPGARGFLILAGGVGVATIWTIGRQLVVRLVPPARRGEVFGLYGVTVKASVVGTAVFGALSKDESYADAILVEAGTLAVGVGLMLWLHVRVAREGR
jgi:UMF1 family MFS transporter